MLNSFFTSLDTSKLTRIIGSANESVIFAAPGLRLDVAKALVEVATRLGSEMLIVCLDVSEQSLRLGFGDLSAIKLLNQHNIVINTIDHLRFGLVLSDGKGYSFAPTALYLESEASTALGFNAIKLTHQQALEATTRLSPAAKAIALASISDKQQLSEIENNRPEIPNNPLEIEQIAKLTKALKDAPPLKFDVSRQVRVYSAYLQYVEVSMTGAAIQRLKIAMSEVLQSIGKTDKELEGRFKTSFELIESSNELSSKELEAQLKKIREDFTKPLGRPHGRVMLKSNKELFNQKIEDLKLSLSLHAKSVGENLQASIDKSITDIAEYYLPLVLKNPPDKMRGDLGMFDDENQVLRWLKKQLEKVFPSAEKMLSKMEISVNFKDVTFENLNHEEFLIKIRAAFPHVNWDKAHEEFLAAAECD